MNFNFIDLSFYYLLQFLRTITFNILHDYKLQTTQIKLNTHLEVNER